MVRKRGLLHGIATASPSSPFVRPNKPDFSEQFRCRKLEKLDNADVGESFIRLATIIGGQLCLKR